MAAANTHGIRTTAGDEHSQGLADSIRQFENAPLQGSRGLPILHGISQARPAFTEPQDNVLLKAIENLNKSGKFYTYGNSVVLEQELFGEKFLSSLTIEMGVKTGVEYTMANHFICQNGETQFPVPRWFAQLLLRSSLLPPRLPRILHYAKRPVFDADYNLLSPGWHPTSQTLVHGPEVDPILPFPPAREVCALDRLPPCMRTLLSGFCFERDADLVNALAAFLTALLGNHFVGVPKGMFLIDGNQPGLGKTLFVRICGIVLDGEEPMVIAYTDDDEELKKHLGAQFRTEGSSIVLIDNAKRANGSAISSVVLESTSVAPEMTFRILGKSELVKRPNDVVWMLTMNTTRVSPDLMSRGVPVRLSYAGIPESRSFNISDPVAYARSHRIELLGELAGMVVQWNQQGRPPGTARHRCHEWAAVVGGILDAAGFPEFLENYREAAAAFDTHLEDLASLADVVLSRVDGPFVEVAEFGGPLLGENAPPAAKRKLTASDWLSFLQAGNVLTRELAESASHRSKAIRAGRFLASCVDREVAVFRKDRKGRARLRMAGGRSGQVLYSFEVVWDGRDDQSEDIVGSS